MDKNYYLILGVPRDAGPLEVRSAFRELAQRYHPDGRGAPDTRELPDVSEAYGVLSDPAARASYDRKLGRRDAPATPASASAPRRDPEPLLSDPIRIADVTATVRPSYDALLDCLRQNFELRHVPKAERQEPLNFELILTPREAQRGILVPFRIPVFAICHHCGGFGQDWVEMCQECDGEGRLVNDDSVDVKVPAGVHDGTTLEVSLEPLGIRNLWLRVFVRVELH